MGLLFLKTQKWGNLFFGEQKNHIVYVFNSRVLHLFHNAVKSKIDFV